MHTANTTAATTGVAEPLTPHEIDEYRRLGFVVRRKLFSPDEMAALAAESQRLLDEHADLIDPANLRCRFMPHFESGQPLFEVFDPVNDISPVCRQMCLDARLVSLVESIYSEPACLFKEKLIFKPAGALGYSLHQDIPRTWPGFPRSFLTALVPIDAANEENGCTEVYAGYHRDFLAPADRPDLYMLPADCVDPARRVSLVLDPGDVALFHGLTPHRSEPNRSQDCRRALYVSYNARSDGGEQRERHYAQFHEQMRSRMAAPGKKPLYFR